MKVRILVGLSLIVFFGACSLLEPTAKVSKPEEEPLEQKNLEEITVQVEEEPTIYQETERRINDLIHTKLEVRFDWEKSRLDGKATLDFKPHFYPVDSLHLDAKGFEIRKVVILDGGKEIPLSYSYDDLVIGIRLNKVYKKEDRYRIKIEYTAKPNERVSGGSEAITSDKGLYFIKPDEKRPNLMPQIWTQGETEANSCWFPTIDAPNEKMTQELYITVKEKYKTLSNGTLVYSVENGDGTRTDYWKQNLPHAPYLVMMAVGEFEVVKDSWRDSVEVHYYVEKPYAPYAKKIFGNTPEMLEFFSKLLGMDYMWDKYHQIVVRDYVSGAMENTSAVIHGDFLYRTDRELLDGDNESIIAHELFHHWFGDLVTCESWANLPLNESFANYSEYLWDEYKYGLDEADHNGYEQMQGYLGESRSKQEDMIRFDYEEKEDMFDAHSYNKGGRILHMLRKFLGDEAFFESLNLYLEQNKFKPAEIHHLRLACEEVSGYDLNWFFNQWFLASGHPQLKISYDFDTVANKQIVTLDQLQNEKITPIYKLPMAIDLYFENGNRQRKNIVLTEKTQSFSFDVPSKPILVNVDAEKILLGEKGDQKPNEQWIVQYEKAPLYLDRLEAVNVCIQIEDPKYSKVLVNALDDRFWGIRELAINNIEGAAKDHGEEVKAKLFEIAKRDKKTSVKSAALVALSKYFKDDSQLTATYFSNFLKDSSYLVIGAALTGLASVDKEKALLEAKKQESEKGEELKLSIGSVYAEHGRAEENEFFQNVFKGDLGPVNTYYMITHYKNYLLNQGDGIIDIGVNSLGELAKKGERWWIRLNSFVCLMELQQLFVGRLDTINKDKEAGEAGENSITEEQKLAKSKVDSLTNLIKELLSHEEDQRIVNRIKSMLGEG